MKTIYLLKKYRAKRDSIMLKLKRLNEEILTPESTACLLGSEILKAELESYIEIVSDLEILLSTDRD